MAVRLKNAGVSLTGTSLTVVYSLLSTLSVAADNLYRIDNANIMLEAGDILKAQAGAANDLMVSAFIEEEITLAS